MRQLLEERSESSETSALTQFIIRNAVSLAQLCVANTARYAASIACAIKRGKQTSKSSGRIIDKFISQVRSDGFSVKHGAVP